MFNVAVLKMKDIIKFLIILAVLVLLISLLPKYISSKKEKQNENNLGKDIAEKISQIKGKSLTGILEQTIPAMSSVEEKEEETKKEDETLSEKILKTEMSLIGSLDENNKPENAENQVVNEEETQENTPNEQSKTIAQEENEQIAKTGLPTEVVTNNPIAESFNVQYGNVKIKNQTSYSLTEDILKPDITIENKNIILFHTHSCESYTSSDLYPYTPTGNFRTTDLNFTVTRVGTELETGLKNYGLSVMHDTSYHDYPSYNGSYTNSL